MHLIDAPPELAKSILLAFGDKIERCSQDLVTGDYEVKFKNAPWSQPAQKGALLSGLLLLDIVQCLEEQGFALRISLDMDKGQGGIVYKSTGEMWFCCQ